MYIKDASYNAEVGTAQASAGSAVNPNYVRSLGAAATTQEAIAEFDNQHYDRAIELFSKALAEPNGRNMKNYSGLYQAYYRSKRREEASNAFLDLLTVAAESGNIGLRLLFAVDSVNFVNDADLQDQYDIWIQRVAQYFSASDKCLTVVGHTSRTGAVDYNMRLSTNRAQAIQKLLIASQPAIARKVRSTGRGFSENLIGSGTDDAQDMLDRRVEFRATSCT
jgi:outer membrane protein OmpA-like peptidoglycan-associated protein